MPPPCGGLSIAFDAGCVLSPRASVAVQRASVLEDRFDFGLEGVLTMATTREFMRTSPGRHWVIVGVAAFFVLAGPLCAFAQSVASGTIEGTVKDESNAILPGVTV